MYSFATSFHADRQKLNQTDYATGQTDTADKIAKPMQIQGVSPLAKPVYKPVNFRTLPTTYANGNSSHLDVYEKEARETADKLTGYSSSKPSTGNELGSRISSRYIPQNKGGTPLAQPVRSSMESQLGKDLSGVRIHEGKEATNLNEQMEANAFTKGQHIYFNQGKYNPSSPEGRNLLTHEVVHTIQQGTQSESVQKDDNGKKKKKTDANPKTKVEVVGSGDFTKDKAKVKAKAKTKRSASQEVGNGVTAESSVETTEESQDAEVALKKKLGKTGLTVTGGLKASDSLNPEVEDKASGFLKVGGKWTPFKSSPTFGLGGGLEFGPNNVMISADGKVYIPTSEFDNTELFGKLKLDSEKGLSANLGLSRQFDFGQNVSVRPDINVGMDKEGVHGGLGLKGDFRLGKNVSLRPELRGKMGPKGKLSASVGLGVVITLPDLLGGR
ncbi:MAG: DUF4157 domain-containing protein [Bacteroidota bacterium]